MKPESIVCWKWRPAPGYRSTFTAETVNTLRRMVARHYAPAHRFICVTDDADGLDPAVEVVPLWDDFSAIPNPFGSRNPSCYRRLRAFHPEIGAVLGRRFVSMDLDCVITGNLEPVFDRPEDFVIWGATHPTTAYNGSLFLLTAGSRRQVWDNFDPHRSPLRAKRARCYGSDQGWISFILGPGEARWCISDGVVSFRNDIVTSGAGLPPEARIVLFHGKRDPWDTGVQAAHPWVAEHYR